MVDPSPFPIGQAKAALRRDLRRRRAEHVAALPSSLRALVLNRPPAPVLPLIPEGAVVGLYHPNAEEAPSLGWARYLSENGRSIALPWFASRDAMMAFRLWDNPWDDDALVPGPWGALQPSATAADVTPDVVIVPLVGFTAAGHRLGQGGGHYDRWLDAHPQVPAIGLAWDCQIVEELPIEAHDRPLRAVVTPTRFYEGLA